MLKIDKCKHLLFRYILGAFFISTPSGYIGSALCNESVSDELSPSSYVQSFLQDYTSKEAELIHEDAKNVKSLCFRDIEAATGNPEYIATAGGPGASKSTILETYLQDKKNYAYLDPDQRALRYMTNTYLQEFTNYKLSQNSDQEKLLQDAYNKWRGASNFIASTLLNEAYAGGYNIAHGTTSTSPYVSSLYKNLKNKSYRIVLLLCHSNDENRINALNYRAEKQNFCQVDPQDIVNKGKMFPERFKDYFQYADEIHFYWTDNFKEGSKQAGSIVRGSDIKVNDSSAMEKFRQQYEKDRQSLNIRETLSLSELMKQFK